MIDVGIDQAQFEPAEELTTPDLLDFAGIEPAHIPAAPLEQHLAEKLHAYTAQRSGPCHQPQSSIGTAGFTQGWGSGDRCCSALEAAVDGRAGHREQLGQVGLADGLP